jgi:hypothetical protein
LFIFNAKLESMAVKFFSLPDDTIFHGIPNSTGFTFRQTRALTDDTDKLKHLKERLDGYYINGLRDINHPFITAIMVCIGIEVLGQVVLGFKADGESDTPNTIEIYKLVNSSLSNSPNQTFKNGYCNSRGLTAYPNELSDYAHIVRSGLRNSFAHSYRSRGIALDASQQQLLIEDDANGLLILNPDLFRTEFITLYEKCLNDAITSFNINYRQCALKYFDLLTQ